MEKLQVRMRNWNEESQAQQIVNVIIGGNHEDGWPDSSSTTGLVDTEPEQPDVVSPFLPLHRYHDAYSPTRTPYVLHDLTKTATRGEHEEGPEFKLGIVAGYTEFPKLTSSNNRLEGVNQRRLRFSESYELAMSSAGPGRSLPHRQQFPPQTTSLHAMPRLDTPVGVQNP